MKHDQTGPEGQEPAREQLLWYMPSFSGRSARKSDRCTDIFRYLMMRNYQMTRKISNGKGN